MSYYYHIFMDYYPLGRTPLRYCWRIGFPSSNQEYFVFHCKLDL
jgi:hypothetical protein